jgi:large subunit ribosomal protein L38
LLVYDNVSFSSEFLNYSYFTSLRYTYVPTHSTTKQLVRTYIDWMFLISVEVPLTGVKEEWLKTVGPSQIKMIADHYGIYDHLFGDAYFVPRVMVDIGFKQKDGNLAPVHRGNIIKPSEASTTPSVSYDSSSEALWTLVLTNPDGNFSDDNSEYVHWFV